MDQFTPMTIHQTDIICLQAGTLPPPHVIVLWNVWLVFILYAMVVYRDDPRPTDIKSC